MHWRSAIILVLLGGATVAQATDVTTYGAGLRTCKDYLEATERQTPDLVSFTDWLSGYLSGVNTTSTHRNNFLNYDDLPGALAWLQEYCQAHPPARLAEASWVLVAGAKTGPAAHSVEVTAYGSGYKSCATYRQARETQTLDLNVDNTQFIAWLGGYLSGANAMSLTSANSLGSTGLTQATQWLDAFCGSHTESSFGTAVQAMIANVHADDSATHLADARAPSVSRANARATSTIQPQTQ
jgi:hypothetical protein